MIEGQCHCGNVRLIIPHLTHQATRCNCSICAKYATLWGYFAHVEVRIDIGELGVTSYVQGDKTIAFHHCSQCGCVTHYSTLKATAQSRVAVNYRLFDQKLLKQISIRYFDGANTFQEIDKATFYY